MKKKKKKKQNGPLPLPPEVRLMRLIRRKSGHWLWPRKPDGTLSIFMWKGHSMTSPRAAVWRLFLKGKCSLRRPCKETSCVHSRPPWTTPHKKFISICGRKNCIHPEHIAPWKIMELPTYPAYANYCRGCRGPVNLHDPEGELMMLARCLCGWQIRGHRQHARRTIAAYERHKKNCAAEFNAYQILRREFERQEAIRKKYTHAKKATTTNHHKESTT